MKRQNRHMEMRALPCQLSDEEIELRSAQLARVTVEERDHQDAFEAFIERHKTEKKRMLEKIAEKTGARLELAREITTRTAKKDIACDWRFDIDSGHAILVRRDTGVAVVKRKMTDDERQLEIGQTLEAATSKQIAAWEHQLQEAEKRGEAIDETPRTDERKSTEGDATGAEA